LAEKAVKKGQKACKIFNEINEKAVKLFLEKKIWFYEISEMIEKWLKEII
jgi:1-deoxy-D-xylulose 5-phosphate reductoisomerase